VDTAEVVVTVTLSTTVPRLAEDDTATGQRAEHRGCAGPAQRQRYESDPLTVISAAAPTHCRDQSPITLLSLLLLRRRSPVMRDQLLPFSGWLKLTYPAGGFCQRARMDCDGLQDDGDLIDGAIPAILKVIWSTNLDEFLPAKGRNGRLSLVCRWR